MKEAVNEAVKIEVFKSARCLRLLWEDARPAFSARIALGRNPVGPKRLQGDGKTPEGSYQLCLVKESGKFGKSLAINYPNIEDARIALSTGIIDKPTFDAIATAITRGVRPPWGSPLGGEIYLHEGDVETDWTQGCIALCSQDMAVLFSCHPSIRAVEIHP